jgi:hypothetical protein
MVAFQNSFITINYTPDTDILSVEWPDFEAETVLEVRNSINKIVDLLKNYDSKNLLIDVSKARISIPYADYNFIIKEFALNLLTTRVVKYARIMSSDPEREENVKSVRLENLYDFQYRDFKTTAEAISWLTGEIV